MGRLSMPKIKGACLKNMNNYNVSLRSFHIKTSLLLVLLLLMPINFGQGLMQDINTFEYSTIESSANLTSKTVVLPTGYIIDQYQIHTNNHRYTAYGWYLVQSFKPSMPILTKIEVLFEIKGPGSQGENLELTIKENLDIAEEPIASSTISYAGLDEKQLWVEFTFDPVNLTTEKTYYIFLNQKGAGDCYWYGIYNNDYYERGYSFGYNMGLSKWENLSDEAIFPNFDFCFKTYSYGDNSPPEIIELDGSLNGKANVLYDYFITSVDEDQDEIYLSVDWGDDTDVSWIGPYESNEQVTLSHTWIEKGSYTISVRTKDSMGNLGEWTTMEVRMPKSWNIFDYLEHISDGIPLLQILKQFLGLIIY